MYRKLSLTRILMALAILLCFSACEKEANINPKKAEIRILSGNTVYMEDGKNAEVLVETVPKDLFSNSHVLAMVVSHSNSIMVDCSLASLKDQGNGRWLAEISFKKDSDLKKEVILKAEFDHKEVLSEPFMIKRMRAIIKELYIKDRRATLDGDTFYATLPATTDFKALPVNYNFHGDAIFINGIEMDGQTDVNFDKPATISVKCGNVTEEYKIVVRNSGLPVVRIETPSRKDIKSKDFWTEGASIRIEMPDGTVSLDTRPTSIRGRGNSTWTYPKKPYALKFDEKAEVLGMPAHKRWVLLANWKDRTLLRNDAAFFLSRQTGLDYTVRGQFVELELNGRHMGNYYLCEQIKINKNRVNIKEMDPMETDPKKITGGFLMELDTYYDEVNKFRSKYFKLPFQFKEPDEESLSPAAKQYMIDYVNNLEAILKDNDRLFNHEYEEFLDVDSAIEFMFVQELANNTDFYNTWPQAGPHSYYMHKDRGGKLMTGPLWDFDYHGFVPTLSHQWAGVTKTVYYPALIKDEKFRERMMELWAKDKEKFAGFAAYVDEMAEKIRLSEEVNHELWPISNRENGDETMTFQQAVNRIKEGFSSKLNWMDSNLGKLK
ncbi:MAG: CotH kinase family protein [Bacteroidales bacterium]|nr:CotH kinase family protein [Bacteroidales bacterium]